jgi:hypothetical protein
MKMNTIEVKYMTHIKLFKCPLQIYLSGFSEYILSRILSLTICYVKRIGLFYTLGIDK